MSLPYNRQLIPRARELRRSMTLQECKLWYQFLSKYSVRFQRQKTIGGFIVDFYCARALLVVEVDGMQHHSEQGKAYDVDRSGILKENELMVLRVDNNEVDHDFTTVCQRIDEAVQRRIKKD